MKPQQKGEINRLRAEGISCRGIADRLSLPLGTVKSVCYRKRTDTPVAKEKCAEALGLAEYDADAFRGRVLGIDVPEDGVLVFRFKDGSEQTLHWEKRSRRDSWTDEMKESAKQHAAARGKYERE